MLSPVACGAPMMWGRAIRAIAADAGVSPGLVVHHFGSKDGLREACDRHVVARFRETKLAAMEEGWAVLLAPLWLLGVVLCF